MLLGRIFGLGAIVRSGLVSNPKEAAAMVEECVSIAGKKSFLREVILRSLKLLCSASGHSIRATTLRVAFPGRNDGHSRDFRPSRGGGSHGSAGELPWAHGLAAGRSGLRYSRGPGPRCPPLGAAPSGHSQDLQAPSKGRQASAPVSLLVLRGAEQGDLPPPEAAVWEGSRKGAGMHESLADRPLCSSAFPSRQFRLMQQQLQPQLLRFSPRRTLLYSSRSS